MRFSVQEKVTNEKEVDVELPRYSRHDLDNSAIYSKLFADEKGALFRLSINIGEDWRSKEESVEMTVHTVSSANLGVNGDYYLGNGEFKSSEDEWVEAVAKADKMLTRFRGA